MTAGGREFQVELLPFSTRLLWAYSK